MNGAIQSADVAEALRRAGQVLAGQSEYLTQLDQAIGDGDMGITMGRIGMALLGYVGRPRSTTSASTWPRRG